MVETREAGSAAGRPADSPATAASDVPLGLMAGIGLSLMTVAFAALVYSGPLTAFLPFGMAVFLLAAAVSLVVTALGSGLPTMLGLVQDKPAALLSGVTAGFTTLAATPEALLSTAVALVTLSSLLVAAGMLLVWRFRLGRVAQFVPYPVVGGFLAGTGWLLFDAGFQVAAGQSLQGGFLSAAFWTDRLPLALPALAAGGLLYLGTRRFSHPLALPALFFAEVALFYLAAALLGADPEGLRADGWLFGPFAEGGGFAAAALLDPGKVALPLLLDALPTLAVVVFLSLIAGLLYLTAIEIALRRELETDREIRTIGIANLLIAPLGATASYPTVGFTTLFTRLGGRGRLMAFTAAGLTAAVALLGPDILEYTPKLALAALVFLLSFDFLQEWLGRSFKRLPLPEYGIVVVIFLTVVVAGFVVAILLGLLICALFFVVKYSALNLVRLEADGTSYRSDVERAPAAAAALSRLGGRMLLFRLEGYLFFGTANLLLNRIRRRLEEREVPVGFLVVDFRLVSGIDASALFVFAKLRQMAENRRLVLVFTEVEEGLAAMLRQAGVLGADDDPQVRRFAETDFGVEWVEERLLGEAGIAPEERSIDAILASLLEGDPRAGAFRRHLERMTLDKGEALYRRGDEDRDLYIIERGEVALFVPLEGGGRLRLRKLGAGTVVGELDFYDRDPRDADAIAESPCVLWRLTAATLRRLSDGRPADAALLHELLARVMARRIGHLTDELRVVLA